MNEHKPDFADEWNEDELAFAHLTDEPEDITGVGDYVIQYTSGSGENIQIAIGDFTDNTVIEPEIMRGIKIHVDGQRTETFYGAGVYDSFCSEDGKSKLEALADNRVDPDELTDILNRMEQHLSAHQIYMQAMSN